MGTHDDHASPPAGAVPMRVTIHTVCGLDELADHGARGVNHVLSILDPGTPEPESFRAYARHRRTTLRFHDAIAAAPGIVLPERQDVEAVLAFGRDLAHDGATEAHVLVHCHAGISRSTAALATLMADAEPGVPAEAIIARLRARRAIAWPNSRMIALADDLLDRGGSLIEAVRRLHAAQLRQRPDLDPIMRELGRAAEVEAALAA